MSSNIAAIGTLFQSTLPRGERLKKLPNSFRTAQFQSTLPRGERQYHDLRGIRDYQFQSTLPRGERLEDYLLSLRQTWISIHAPARGATGVSKIRFRYPERFQSTLPRGERHILVSEELGTDNFNPRSREGSDDEVLIQRHDLLISIHAPARGATCIFLA